jgi:type II secretory pathway component PulF
MKPRRDDSESVSEISGALSYAIIMMCVGTAIMAFLVAYVVPQVATIFEQQHAALPLLTKLLIRFSALISRNLLAETMLLLWSVTGIVVALATARGRRVYVMALNCTTVWEPVMTIAMAAVIVFMMLAVLMPIFQLNQLMQ